MLCLFLFSLLLVPVPCLSVDVRHSICARLTVNKGKSQGRPGILVWYGGRGGLFSVFFFFGLRFLFLVFAFITVIISEFQHVCATLVFFQRPFCTPDARLTRRLDVIAFLCLVLLEHWLLPAGLFCFTCPGFNWRRQEKCELRQKEFYFSSPPPSPAPIPCFPRPSLLPNK